MTTQLNNEFNSIRDDVNAMAAKYGFDVAKLKNVEKRKVLRNCVVPEIGKYIFERIKNDLLSK